MRSHATEDDEDWEEDNLDVMPGSITVGDEYEIPCLLDRRGDPIELPGNPVGFSW